MSAKNKEHALREHLALISTETYLLLRSDDETERIDRYNTIQDTITTIINLMDDRHQVNPAFGCPDVMLR